MRKLYPTTKTLQVPRRTARPPPPRPRHQSCNAPATRQKPLEKGAIAFPSFDSALADSCRWSPTMHSRREPKRSGWSAAASIADKDGGEALALKALVRRGRERREENAAKMLPSSAPRSASPFLSNRRARDKNSLDDENMNNDARARRARRARRWQMRGGKGGP